MYEHGRQFDQAYVWRSQLVDHNELFGLASQDRSAREVYQPLALENVRISKRSNVTPVISKYSVTEDNK